MRRLLMLLLATTSMLGCRDSLEPSRPGVRAQSHPSASMMPGGVPPITGATLTRLGAPPGGTSADPLAINSAGAIAGAARFGSGGPSAFVRFTGGSFTQITVPQATSGHASGINADGVVVGFIPAPTGNVPFVWTQAGGVQSLGGAASAVEVRGLNASGQVIGQCYGPGATSPYQACLWADASPSTVPQNLGYLALMTGPSVAHVSEATAINTAGDVVGRAYSYNTFNTSQMVSHAMLKPADQPMIDLGTLPGDVCSFATGINDVGQVIGVSASGSVETCNASRIPLGAAVLASMHAFIWTQATGMQPLGELLAGEGSWPRGINNVGIVVGVARAKPNPLASVTERPFVWTPGGGMVDLGTPGQTVSTICQCGHANAINEQNQIAGAVSFDASATFEAVIWTLQFAQANQPPNAATSGPYWGIRGQAVAFNGSASSDPENGALTYAWDFGDGTTGSGATPSHTYPELGAYVVTLTVMDPDGATGSVQTTATIEVPAPLVTVGEKYACGLRADGLARCWGSAPYGGASAPPNVVFTQLTAGFATTCGLRSDSTIQCWGSDGTGQNLAPAGPRREVSMGQYHACALAGDGLLDCWGGDSFGAKGLPAGTYAQVSAGWLNTCAIRPDGTIACAGYGYPNNGGTFVPPAGVFVQVSSGEHHSCALKLDRSIVCWGANGVGEVGAPPSGGFATIAHAGSYREVRAGQGSTCALAMDGSVSCWGYNGDGRTNEPLGTYEQIAVGSSSACAMRANATVICWGSNADGQLNVHSDFQPPPLAIIPSVEAGQYHSCALSAAGAVTCWGLNDDGRATPPANLATIAQLSTGWTHNCALRRDRTIICWGRDHLGDITPTAGLLAEQISAGGLMTCALKSGGIIDCFGSSTDGETTPPAGLTGVLQVSAAMDAMGCAVKSDATVVCWGFQSDGRTNVPAGLSSVTQISTGATHSCARKSDGTVVCWGPNAAGAANVPAGLSDVVQVASGAQHTCALKSNGTVTCWGLDTDGRSTPPVGLTSVMQIDAGQNHTCARRTDATIVCWGTNSTGQLDVPPALRPPLISQAISFTSSPASPKYLGTYAITANGGGSGNSVTFASSTPSVCTVAASIATFVGVGTCTITANQAGSQLFAAATQATQTFVVDKAEQSITVTSTPTNTVYGGSTTMSATGGASGNPITFSSLTNTICTVTGATVAFTDVATCTVAANQAGNSLYADAPQVTQSIVVSRASQTVTFTSSPPNPALLDGTYTVSGSAVSGPVSFASNTPTVCTMSGATTVRFIGVGTCGVIASRPTDNHYLAAQTPQTFQVIYAFTGYLAPVANVPAVNTEKSGSVVKLKFGLAGNRGLGIVVSAQVGQITGSCATTALPATTSPAIAAAALKYDATTNQYLYSWQTQSAWKNTCQQFILTLIDGTVHRANFNLTK